MTTQRKTDANTFEVKVAPEHSAPLRKAGETHKRGISGFLADLVDQYFNKRKLGCYIHEDAHKREIARLERNITTLEGQMSEIKEATDELVSVFGLPVVRDGAHLSQVLCVVRDKASDTLKEAEKHREENEAYVKQITELKETTLPKTEHEELIASALSSKEEVEKQLQSETESVKRLNVKFTEQESEINKLKTKIGAQASTILSLRDEVQIACAMEKYYEDLYTQEYRKPFWRRFMDSLMGRPDLPCDEPVTSEEEPPPAEDAPQKDKDDV